MFNIIPKKIMLNLAVLVISSIASHATESLPGFTEKEILHFGPARTRLVVVYDGSDEPYEQTRHTNFNVECFGRDSKGQEEWEKVGMVTVQTNGKGTYCFPEFGTHVRIQNITIDSPYRKQSIGTWAIETLLAFYEEKGGFDCFKLEASNYPDHLGRWYRKLGFSKSENSIGGYSDVFNYKKELVKRPN